MSQSKEIQFWAHQFFEHFTLIPLLLEREGLLNDDETKKVLKDLKSQWGAVEKNPKGYKDLDNLIQRSHETKSKIQKQLTAENLPCLPDLLGHMIEELNYFESAILNQEWSLLEELQWWAQEHSENLDFARCELPILIKEDSLMANLWGHSKEVDQMAEKNHQLSAQFKNLSKATNTNVKKLYDKLIVLKNEHLKGLTEQINNVDQLPLNEDTIAMVYDMLRHESAEAEFAFQRLEKLMKNYQ